MAEQLYPTGALIKELRSQGYGHNYISIEKLTAQNNENFSRLARPLRANFGEWSRSIPIEWDKNITVSRIDGQLREILIGPGRRYQEGPTGCLIRKGKAGEFAYRAHQERYREDMPRSHGIGHWEDTFGTGEENVIAAASSLAAAKTYKAEFIYKHGKKEKDIGFYMIDLEDLNISYVDESIALNSNIQEYSDIESIFDQHGAVVATEVHIDAPIPKGKVVDITDIIYGEDVSGTSESDYKGLNKDASPYCYTRNVSNEEQIVKPKSKDELEEERQLKTMIHQHVDKNKDNYVLNLSTYIARQKEVIRGKVSQQYAISQTRVFRPSQATRLYLFGDHW